MSNAVSAVAASPLAVDLCITAVGFLVSLRLNTVVEKDQTVMVIESLYSATLRKKY